MLAKEVVSNTGSFAPMLNILAKLILKTPKQSNRGFTLVELLVAMIIATIVITPLLGFMVNTLNSDRIEQAKATSEAEIQAALDYIAQDMEQAVYIYDATALNANVSNNPLTSGIKDQIPPVAAATGCNSTTNCTPVLVFWKRETEKEALPITSTASPIPKDDTFVYSLVAYYLVESPSTTFKEARIARFQIKDGVVDPNDPINSDSSPKYVAGKSPSAGYRGFVLNGPGSTLEDKMRVWRKSPTVAYTDQAVTLIDFVDKGIAAPTQNCPTTPTPMEKVPTTQVGGFYACVDSTNNIAQVFIRGNALARINDNRPYEQATPVYFPTASIQVEGRGYLGVN